MIIIPENFSTEKFTKRYGVGDGEWSVVGKTGELVCLSLPDLTTADIDDCVMDALTPKTEERFEIPIVAPDFIVQSPKPKKDHLEAQARAIEISKMADKSIPEIVLNLVVYIDELEKRLAKKNI